MAGTGGTTTYTPMSVLTGTTLLPKKPVVVAAKPTTTPTKALTTLQSLMSSTSGSSSSSSSKPKTATSTTSSSAPKLTSAQKTAITSLAGLPAALPAANKDAISAAFLNALAQAARVGGAVSNPPGLTGAEADKLRSQFYSNMPVQRIADDTGSPQAMLSYDVNKRIDPALLDSLSGSFAPQAAPLPLIPGGMGIGFGLTPAAGLPGTAVAPFMAQGIRPGTPAGMPAAPFMAQGVRPGTPAGMPAAPFMAQGVRPGTPAGMPAAPIPPAPAGGIYDTDMLNSKGIARYLMKDIMPQTATSQTQQGGGFDLMNLLVGQAQGAEYPNTSPVSPEMTEKYGALSPGQELLPLPGRGDPNDWLGQLYRSTLASGAGAANALIGPAAGLAYGVGGAFSPDPIQGFLSGYQQGSGDVNRYFDPAMQLDPVKARKAGTIADVGTLAAMLPLGPERVGLAAAARGAETANAGINAAKPLTAVDNVIDAGFIERAAQLNDERLLNNLMREMAENDARVLANTMSENNSLNALNAAQDARVQGFGPINPGPTVSDPLSVVTPKGPPLAPASKASITPAEIALLAASLPVGAAGAGLGLYSLLKPSGGVATPPNTASRVPTLEAEVAAMQNTPPDNSQRLPQAVTNDLLASLQVNNNIDPAIRAARDAGYYPGAAPSNVNPAIASVTPRERPSLFDFAVSNPSWAIEKMRAIEDAGTMADNSDYGNLVSGLENSPNRTADMMSQSAKLRAAEDYANANGIEVSDEYGGSNDKSDQLLQIYKAKVEPNLPKSGGTTAGAVFTPGPGQFVGTNGYVYEQSGDGSFKQVGKVPGYTDAQLYEAANKGAFRNPNAIPVGSAPKKKAAAKKKPSDNTVKASEDGGLFSGFTDIQNRLDDFRAENRRKIGLSPRNKKADGGMVNKYGSGGIASWITEGSKEAKAIMDPPTRMEQLAAAGWSPSMMEGSPSTSSRNTSAKNSDGKAGSGSSSTTTTTSGAPAGYTPPTQAQIDALYAPYFQQAVMPPATYVPGLSGEFNYFPTMPKPVTPPSNPLIQSGTAASDWFNKYMNAKNQGDKKSARKDIATGTTTFHSLFDKYRSTLGNKAQPSLQSWLDWYGKQSFAEGGAVLEPRLVLGHGGPTSDNIPANIDGVQEARLSNGEFVMTAAAVKNAGDGDMQKGAERLMHLNEMLSYGRPAGKLNVEKVAGKAK